MVRKASLSGMINQTQLNADDDTDKFSASAERALCHFRLASRGCVFSAKSNRATSRVKAGSQEIIAANHARRAAALSPSLPLLIAALERSFFGSSPSVDQFNLVRSIAIVEPKAHVDS